MNKTAQKWADLIGRELLIDTRQFGIIKVTLLQLSPEGKHVEVKDKDGDTHWFKRTQVTIEEVFPA